MSSPWQHLGTPGKGYNSVCLLSPPWLIGPNIGSGVRIPGDHPEPFHDHQGMHPVQCDICLVDIYKDIVQHVLTRDCDILKEFSFQGGRPCSFLSSDSMQNISELNRIRQELVNYNRNYFPKNPHQVDSTVLPCLVFLNSCDNINY